MFIRGPIPAARRLALATAVLAALCGQPASATDGTGTRGVVSTIDTLRHAGDWTRALALCEDALRSHPGDVALLRRQVLILADAGATSRARELARQLPADPALLARLDADAAARRTTRAVRDSV